jgi:hypothetical protein
VTEEPGSARVRAIWGDLEPRLGVFEWPSQAQLREHWSSSFPVTPKNSDPLEFLLHTAPGVEKKVSRAESFDDAFPNLTKLGEKYRSLPFDHLNAILGEESKRSKGELEIFGAKIPNELVGWIGIPALGLLFIRFISTCLYLLKHADSIRARRSG